MADALNDAVRLDDVALVKQLVEGGVDVNGVEGGSTALYWAATRGFVECTKVLLEANADVNKLLIQGKANVNAKAMRDREIPLHLVAGEGELACIEMLISAGAEVDALDDDGDTPLVWAIIRKRPGAAELLVDKGAKMSNLPEDLDIPHWMSRIITKRQNFLVVEQSTQEGGCQGMLLYYFQSGFGTRDLIRDGRGLYPRQNELNRKCKHVLGHVAGEDKIGNLS